MEALRISYLYQSTTLHPSSVPNGQSSHETAPSPYAFDLGVSRASPSPPFSMSPATRAIVRYTNDTPIAPSKTPPSPPMSASPSGDSPNCSAAAMMRRRRRTAFTGDQLLELVKEFHSRKYLSLAERSVIARQLRLTEVQVRVHILTHNYIYY